MYPISDATVLISGSPISGSQTTRSPVRNGDRPDVRRHPSHTAGYSGSVIAGCFSQAIQTRFFMVLSVVLVVIRFGDQPHERIIRRRNTFCNTKNAE
jgi:hypothetical protein